MDSNPQSPRKTFAARLMRGIAIAIAAALLIGIGLYLMNDFIIGKILIRQLSKYCGSPVTIEEIDVSPETGRVDIQNICVANPAGFSDQPLMSAKTFMIDIKPSSLWKKEKVVEELYISDFTLFYERLDAGKNNVSTLIDSFSKKPKSKSDPFSEVRYRVDKLRMFNTKAILLINGRINIVKIDDIKLNDIGKDKALTLDELIECVVTHFSGIFDSENFAIRNPDGYTERDFIHIGNFHVDLDMKDVPRRRYRIENITADEFSLNLETLANGRNNMQELAASLMKDQQKAQARPRTATVDVDEFLIRDVKLVLSYDGISKRISLGKLELKDIGKKQPMSAEEVAIYLLMQLNDFVNRSGKQVAAAQRELKQECAKREAPAATAAPKSAPEKAKAPAPKP